MKQIPILYIITPCYNEAQVLPKTAPRFLEKLMQLIHENKIAKTSRILFVNDGSKDETWKIIAELSESDEHFQGISQSRNRGHQNAVWAGLMESRSRADITISIDCDGQQDINAIDKMIFEYENGNEIVYGVRTSRKTDSFFKSLTARAFYTFINLMGAEVIRNHADFRLISSTVLNELSKFKEVNLFLRGIVPLVGFKSTKVYFEVFERVAGESHYPLSKMLGLACDGITSLSVKPIRLISLCGLFVSFISLIGIIYVIVCKFLDEAVSGWASLACIIFFVSGMQALFLGVIGEYIGKIYLETKARPRYIISERTKEFLDE